MSNSFTRKPKPDLILEQLRAHSAELDKAIAAPGQQTREDLYEEAAKLLEKLSLTIQQDGLSSNLELPARWQRILKEHIPGNLNNLTADTVALFGVYESLGKSIVEGWNIAASKLGRVKNKTQLVASRLVDLNMFRNGSTDAFVWGDSFDNLSRLDMSSSLIKEDLCTINDADGVVTLPLDTEVDPAVPIEKITINGNGVIGNNTPGFEYHGVLADILDSNPDTWTEYERLVDPQDETTEPLALTIMLTLQEVKIVNELRINPNNFGTARTAKIIEIETSLDGEQWLSIKDEIPFADFMIDDEENIFRLGPSSSKFSGQGVYVFLPRQAKYVRIYLSQKESYAIETSNGPKLRYAIGIRDIELRANVYKSTGAILSKPILLESPARKIFIKTAQNPASENDFAAIKHLVSWDGGSTWAGIKPLDFIGTPEVKEVININGPEDGAIDTGDIIPDKLRYKAIFSRNDSAFGLTGTFRKAIDTITETSTFPSTSPFRIALQNTPVSEPIVVQAGGNLGSKGRWTNPYRTTASRGIAVALPQYAPRTFDSEDFTVPTVNLEDFNARATLGNYPIGRRYPMETSYFDSVVPSGIAVSGVIPAAYDIGPVGQIGSYAKNPVVRVRRADTREWLTENSDYYVNESAGMLEFVYDTANPTDLNPGIDTPRLPFEIEVFFPPERGRVDSDDILHLEHPVAHVTDGGLTLKVVKGPEKEGFAQLEPGLASHKLPHQNIIRSSAKIKGPTVYDDLPQDFYGNKAGLAPGEWTIDYINGYIHTSTASKAQAGDFVTYWYIDVDRIEEGEGFDIIPGKADRVQLKTRAKYPLEGTVTFNPAGSASGFEIFHLGHPSVVPGSLRFTGTDEALFTRELPFDPSMYIKATKDEPLVVNTPWSAITSIISYKLRFRPWSPYWEQATFSNTALFKIFKQPTEALAVEGDWKFTSTDPAFRTIELYTAASPATPGSVSYPYLDPSRDLTTGGFMVDYQNGVLYTFAQFTNQLKIDYHYLYLLAEYDIAKQLKKNKDYEVSGNSIVLRATAIRDFANQEKQASTALEFEVDGAGSPRSAGGVTTTPIPEDKLYITYEYNKMGPENLGELKKYFSPILRGYSLQIVDENRIIA